jgi:3-deoxy-D-manno-octulosonate 8-phosphate phosphatase (KDO 8-P phosphatase)
MNKIDIQVRKRKDCGDLPYPAYMTDHAAGMDLMAAVTEEVVLPSGRWEKIPTGISIALPYGLEAQVRARSGLAYKHGIGLINGPGTVDSDYRGEIGVLLINHGPEPFTIRRGDRIAQMIIAPVLQAAWEAVDVLPDSARSEGGFGHTGHNHMDREGKKMEGDVIREKAEKIQWIFLDVDGVLTDGGIIYDSRGGESKIFHVRDGHGIKLAQRAGLRFAFITGRASEIVSWRARELGVEEVHQGAKKKLEAYDEITQRLRLTDEKIAYIGDDLIDIPVLQRVGLSAVVSDADVETRAQADLILSYCGGRGAVREFVEIILKAQGKWEEATKRYYP